MKTAVGVSAALVAGFMLGVFAHGLAGTAPVSAAQTATPSSDSQPGCPEKYMMPKHPHSQADMDLMQSMVFMQTCMMGMNLTGDTDRDFMIMMIPHHQAAISMASIEIKYGMDPRVRALATSIITAQSKEIGEMNGWLMSPHHRP